MTSVLCFPFRRMVSALITSCGAHCVGAYSQVGFCLVGSRHKPLVAPGIYHVGQYGQDGLWEPIDLAPVCADAASA